MEPQRVCLHEYFQSCISPKLPDLGLVRIWVLSSWVQRGICIQSGHHYNACISHRFRGRIVSFVGGSCLRCQWSPFSDVSREGLPIAGPSAIDDRTKHVDVVCTYAKLFDVGQGVLSDSNTSQRRFKGD